MTVEKGLSKILQKLMSQFAMSLFFKLSDRKIIPEEFKQIAQELTTIVASSLNNVYQEQSGKRPIDVVNLKINV